jgi:hypothetical protein
MAHRYSGSGVDAYGPALLLRKDVGDSLALSAGYLVDIVSNASIDVVTTASAYHERREERSAGVDYLYQDALLSLGVIRSREPDYQADSVNVDLAQDLPDGLTTLRIGTGRGWDNVGRKGYPAFAATADHWQYRVGVTRVLTGRWMAGLQAEALSDAGFLGSPYRAARVFGALVPEQDPATRTARALALRVNGAVGAHGAVRILGRYYWDTWGVRADTLEAVYAHAPAAGWSVEGLLRGQRQAHANFYSDNFATAMQFMSRSRQLADQRGLTVGVKAGHELDNVPGRYSLRLSASLERQRTSYADFTDMRTGALYVETATVSQINLSATF